MAYPATTPPTPPTTPPKEPKIALPNTPPTRARKVLIFYLQVLFTIVFVSFKVFIQSYVYYYVQSIYISILSNPYYYSYKYYAIVYYKLFI